MIQSLMIIFGVLLFVDYNDCDYVNMEIEKTPLFQAIEVGDVPAVISLINNDYRVIYEKSEFDITSLMAAVSSPERKMEIIKAIVDAGVDVNARTSEGYTALHMMVDINGLSGTGSMPYDIAELLVKNGTNMEAKQHWGWTPLMKAALEGTDDEFIAILKAGAKADVRYGNNSFPEFTRGRSIMHVVLSDPKKVEALIDNNYKVVIEHIQEAESMAAEANEEFQSGRALNIYEDSDDIGFERTWIDEYIDEINQSEFSKIWRNKYLKDINQSILILKNAIGFGVNSTEN